MNFIEATTHGSIITRPGLNNKYFRSPTGRFYKEEIINDTGYCLCSIVSFTKEDFTRTDWEIVRY